MAGEVKLSNAQREYDPEFIVICASAWMNESGFGINYSWDGERFNNRNDAIRHGYAIRGSDDFNIGQTYGDNLVWFGWMDQRMDEPEETAREIAEAIGLEFDPSWYALKYSKSTGRVIGRAALKSGEGRVLREPTREEARALTDAGYMPVSEYVRLFGEKPK